MGRQSLLFPIEGQHQTCKSFKATTVRTGQSLHQKTAQTAQIHTCIQCIHSHSLTHTHTHTHTKANPYARMHGHLLTHTSAHTHTHAHTKATTHARMHGHILTHTHTHTHTYTHTHINTHKQTISPLHI